MNYEYCNGFTYTIRKGDTLYEISRRHKVPLAMLLRANPFVDVFNLQIGDTLCIPGRPATPENHENCPEVPKPVPCYSEEVQNQEPSMMKPKDVMGKQWKEDTIMQPDEIDNGVQEENISSGPSEKAERDLMNTENRMRPVRWRKYVVKPGDTLKDLIGDTEMGCEFLEKNDIDSIYLLPGIAYQVPEK